MKALLLLGVLAQASVEGAPVPRADTHAAVGWQNLRKDQTLTHYNDWINRILYAGAGAGWYWTEHLKTQVDFGAGTRGDQYRVRQILLNGLPVYESSRASVGQQSLAIGQQYQFFRNQWFHPHVGVGIELARESVREAYQPVVVFDNQTRSSRLLVPGHDEGPEDHVLARPFGEAGFKSYVSRRAFFTGDVRLMFRHGIDEILFRVGLGVDF